jgi:hypothetical protein
MRVFLTLLILLSFTVPSFAQQVIVAKKKSSVDECTTQGSLGCQNFETAITGYDNDETWVEAPGAGATINPAYTTTALRGSQSGYIGTGTEASNWYRTITTSGEVYAFFRFQFSADVTGNVMGFYNGATPHFLISYNATSNTISVTGGTGTCAVVPNTTYYIWVYYKKGTGADAIKKLWVSTTSTKPGSTCSENLAGTNTADITRLYFPNTLSSFNAIYDQVLVSATEIGDVQN